MVEIVLDVLTPKLVSLIREEALESGSAILNIKISSSLTNFLYQIQS
jgi:hypothetical protein